MIVVAAYALILAHPGPAFKTNINVRQAANWKIAPQEVKFNTVDPRSLDPRQRDALLRENEPRGREKLVGKCSVRYIIQHSVLRHSL